MTSQEGDQSPIDTQKLQEALEWMKIVESALGIEEEEYDR